MTDADSGPTLKEIVRQVGEAGLHLAEIGAANATAGNVSVYLPNDRTGEIPGFDRSEPINLPVAVPELGGGSILVSGSGRRLREIAHHPLASLGLVVVQPGGAKGVLWTARRSRFERLTVELNTHVAIHREHARRDGQTLHAVIHAQPPYITFLSHVPEYRDYMTLNRRILRWEPESIYHLRDGVAIVPFHVPSSESLMADTLDAMRDHRVVLWAKHGLIARSASSVKRACDLIEFAETGARFEVLNLQAGGIAEGLQPEEIRGICAAFDIRQELF